MKTLSAREEEIMDILWEKGPLFVKEMVELYEEPRPHFNTLSTFVRGLEEKGYVGHRALVIPISTMRKYLVMISKRKH